MTSFGLPCGHYEPACCVRSYGQHCLGYADIWNSILKQDKRRSTQLVRWHGHLSHLGTATQKANCPLGQASSSLTVLTHRTVTGFVACKGMRPISNIH